MSALVLAAWLSTMALLAWRGRPISRPVGRATGGGPIGVASGRRRSRRAVDDRPLPHAAARVGGAVQRRLPALLVVPAVSLGAAVVIGVAIAPVSPVWGATVAVAVAVSAWWHRRAVEQRRRRRLERELPMLVELVRLSIDAGLTTRMALVALAPHLDGEIGSATSRLVVELERGESLVSALERLGEHLGGSIEELTTVLVGAEHTGARLSPLLGRLADDLRRSQRIAADERARRLPVLLLVPLVFCVLPAFVIVAVVPMLVTGTASLSFPSP